MPDEKVRVNAYIPYELYEKLTESGLNKTEAITKGLEWVLGEEGTNQDVSNSLDPELVMSLKDRINSLEDQLKSKGTGYHDRINSLEDQLKTKDNQISEKDSQIQKLTDKLQAHPFTFILLLIREQLKHWEQKSPGEDCGKYFFKLRSMQRLQ